MSLRRSACPGRPIAAHARALPDGSSRLHPPLLRSGSGAALASAGAVATPTACPPLVLALVEVDRPGLLEHVHDFPARRRADRDGEQHAAPADAFGITVAVRVGQMEVGQGTPEA